MRSLPFFAFGLMGLVCMIMFGRLPGASSFYGSVAPNGECIVVEDDFVVLEIERDEQTQRVQFNENGYYYKNTGSGIVFKHWHDDWLMYRWKSPFDENRRIVTDHRSFWAALDEDCYGVLRGHPVMKWDHTN